MTPIDARPAELPAQVEIARDDIVVTLSSFGAAILGAAYRGTSFIRQYPDRSASRIDMTKVGSFPFVPFGGRVAGNAFTCEGRTYRLAPNVPWDPLYLHGDAWLLDWRVAQRSPAEIVLELDHPAIEGAPYGYRARQRVAIADGVVSATLEVVNVSGHALPFGLGHHPFFPLTPRTTLSVDGGSPQAVPIGPVDRAADRWAGGARIVWPEHALVLDIDADASFGHYMLYVPDTSFDTSYNRDYFCFEPMTHALDGHHRPGLGGLRLLAAGESMSATVALRPRPAA